MSHQPKPEAVAHFILREVEATGLAPIEAEPLFEECRGLWPTMSFETFADALGLAAQRINAALAEHRANQARPSTVH